MKVLVIDTSSNKEVIVGLKINGEEFLHQQPIDQRKAQVVLPLIEQLLQEHKISLNDLTAIEVNAGPGSFTGLRVGITIANTLGSMLQIPINGRKTGDIVEPVYA